MNVRYTVSGMSCAACSAHVQRSADAVISETGYEGKIVATVVLLSNSMTVSYPDGMTKKEISEIEDKLKKAIKKGGYVMKDHTSDNGAEADKKGLISPVTRLIISLALTLLLMAVSMGHMVGLHLPDVISSDVNPQNFALVQFVISLAVVVLNFGFYSRGMFSLFHGAPNMDTLIAIGSGSSMLYGIVATVMIFYGKHTGDTQLVHTYVHDLYFESAAMILALVSLGKTLEGKAKKNAADAVAALTAMLPVTARVLRDGAEMQIPAEQLEMGDIIIVKSGEVIPADAVVIEGEGGADESSLTGESIPVSKAIGAKVSGSCTLVSGYIRARVEKIGEDTAFSRIIKLLEEASATKAPISRLADRVSGIFVPVVIGISIVTFGSWMIFSGDFSAALRSAVCVLVISCPCALGLATPTAVLIGTGRGAREGVFFRNAEALEYLGQVRTVFFDKTGTVTCGKPTLSDVIVADGAEISEGELVSVAYSVEKMSSHPLSAAVCSYAEEISAAELPTEGFFSVTGQGIGAVVDGKTVLIGKPDLLCDRGVNLNSAFTAAFEAEEDKGKTVVAVSIDGSAAGILCISDTIREDTREAIEQLHKLGVKTVMLTGDNERTAAAMSRAAGIDDYRASLLPEDKERIVREAVEVEKDGKHRKSLVAMVGDGINDAPALARADVGVAMGTGTEVAIDSADVVLTGDSVNSLVRAVRLSRRTMRIIRQNLFWAMFYNSVGIPVAAGVLFPAFGIALSPMIAAAAMSFSSVSVVCNALRLKRRK
ncbi:MAG: copper-translocating P-type ATPase [Clostridia bacterium]|nr:copper-translocating P-type ATPase [Clostridia bacterium]